MITCYKIYLTYNRRHDNKCIDLLNKGVSTVVFRAEELKRLVLVSDDTIVVNASIFVKSTLVRNSIFNQEGLELVNDKFLSVNGQEITTFSLFNLYTVINERKEINGSDG